MAVAIALGGGAPNFTLMTGALWALDRCGVKFKVITTTGAGMVAGLLYTAPRLDPGESWKEARQRALLHTREMGIDDLIYDQFPMNYKIFQKSGKRAEAFARIVTPWVFSIPRDTRRQRLLGDTLGLMAAMAQPWDLSPLSRGLCQPPPWIDVMVDFNELSQNLETGKINFRLSAYCIEDGAMRSFKDSEINAESFKAGLAMPFLYAPFTIPDRKTGKPKTYLEGSAFQTMELNPDGIMTDNDIDTIIIFDLMGHKNLIGAPKNLIDAWGKSIVAPLTRIATSQKEMLQLKRALYDIMKTDRKLIRSFDLSTRTIEVLLHRLRHEAAQPGVTLETLQQEVERAIGTIFDQIDDRRKQRASYIDHADQEGDGEKYGLPGEETPDKGEEEAIDKFETSTIEFIKWLREHPLASDVQRIVKEHELLEESDKKITENVDQLLVAVAEKYCASDVDHDDHIKARFQDAERNWAAYRMNLAWQYRSVVDLGDDKISDEYPAVIEMPFTCHIPQDQWPSVLDWSHSNMATLWDIGRDTAFHFVEGNYKRLGLNEKPSYDVIGVNRLEYPHLGEQEAGGYNG